MDFFTTRPQAAPLQLLFPDGKWSLGMNETEHVAEQEEDTDEQDTGSSRLVIWSDPPRGSTINAERRRNTRVFAVLLVVDVILSLFFLVKNEERIRNETGETRTLLDNAPHVTLERALFVISMCIRILAIVGVLKRNYRLLTICFSLGLAVIFVDVLWLESLVELVRLAVNILFIAWIFRIRETLIGKWFSTLRAYT